MITFWAVMVVLASIAVVAWPLLRGIDGRSRPALVEDTEVSELLAQKEATLLAISELESDYGMGNLSQGDYRELRQKYEEKAMALMKTMDQLRSEPRPNGFDDIDDEIEARVSQLRVVRETAEPEPASPALKVQSGKREPQLPTGKSCPSCGARLDIDDLFCSHCGAALSLKCPDCSAAVDSDDRFCSRCGAALSAKGDGRKAGQGD